MAKKTIKCCFCKTEINGYGNSPAPVNNAPNARCCDICNLTTVIPARVTQLKKDNAHI